MMVVSVTIFKIFRKTKVVARITKPTDRTANWH